MINLNQLNGIGDFIYFQDVEKKITRFIETGEPFVEVHSTNFEKYDEFFKWIPSEITGVSGIPNHGKSKWVVFLAALKMYFANWNVAFYSAETYPSEFFYLNFLHTLTGKNIFRGGKPTKDEITKSSALLNKNLSLFQPDKYPTINGIMDKFTMAHEKHGCKMFVIDPFNCLDREWEKSKRDDQYVGEFLERYKEFAVKTNSCCIIVMHPNAGIKLPKNDIDFECPNVYNLAGGAMWNNKCDNIMFVHRPKFISNRTDSTVLIRHSKIKKREINGLGGDVFFDFDFKHNRYTLESSGVNFCEAEPQYYGMPF